MRVPGRMAESSISATLAVASAKRLAAPSGSPSTTQVLPPSQQSRSMAVAVEHDVAAGLDHVALEARSERERGICAARMTPHHTARIAHETAQLGDGACIGLIEIPPGRTLVPGGD